MHRFKRQALSLLAVCILAAPLHAASVLTLANGHQLFSSGIAANGSPAASASVDVHYVMSLNPNASGPDTVVSNHPNWSANTANSQWIGAGPGGGTNQLIGVYSATTQIDLTGMDLATVVITGHWASDNDGHEIRINGNSSSSPKTGNFADANFNTNPVNLFTINNAGGFLVNGVNDISFVYENTTFVSPAGVRVELEGASGSLVPEPASVSLLGGAALLTLRRRRH
jgi:hypothetical protein